MEIFEIYDDGLHLGSLYIENNRYRLEFEVADGDYEFELMDTDWVKPIPFFERILAQYNNDQYAVVLKDKDSSIVLYKID